MQYDIFIMNELSKLKLKILPIRDELSKLNKKY